MNKKILIIFSCLFCILIVSLITVLGMSFAYEEINIAEEKNNSESRANIGNIAPGEIDPSTYPYNIHIGVDYIETSENRGKPDAVPSFGNFEIHCIQHGAHIAYMDSQISYAEALQFVGRDHSNCIPCASTPRDGEKTLPIYREIGSGTLSPALAYIISSDPVRVYSYEKSKAIWNAALMGLDGGLVVQTGTSDGPSSLDSEMQSYADYDSKVRGKGLQIEDKSKLTGNANQDSDVVHTFIDKDTQKYTVGPYKVQYTNGIYGNIAFSGISNITALGYNKDGKKVKDIKIDQIILRDSVTGQNGTAINPQYFQPDPTYKTDRNPQVYPAPNQFFYIVFSDPNKGIEEDDPNYITSTALKIDFKYMLADGAYAKLEGYKYQVSYSHEHVPHQHTYKVDVDEEGNPIFVTVDCQSCTTTGYLQPIRQQDLATFDAIRTLYEQSIIIGENQRNDIFMELGGYVWEDKVASKESIADGIINTSGDNLDIRLKNVKVTLYEENGDVAKLAVSTNEGNIMHRINPTYTDEDGRYLFEGMNPMKKYYVVFEYNGQKYMPTEYLNTSKGQFNSALDMANAGLYNTNDWNITSKGTESISKTETGVEISRNDFDKRFEEIQAYPENYKSSNNLGWAQNGYNTTYTQIELMGYTLGEDGKYSQTETQLIDGFKYDQNGLETTEFSEGEISKQVRNYINKNKRFPNDGEMKQIYSDIAKGDGELQKKLQFIEDCYIQSYSGAPKTQQKDTYPLFDQLDGQYYINLGLWRRQEFDNAVRKDVYKATLKINDKTVVYNYDKRGNEDGGNNEGNGQDNDSYWDINVRMSDYEKYYNSDYNREIYETDYSYDSAELNHPGSDLEVYITYKITIRNQSMSIMNQVKEVVDYYDKDYTYKPNLSWVIYQTDQNKNTSINKDEFYNMMKQSQKVIDDETTSATDFIDNSKDPKASDNSRYNNQKNLGNNYKNLYIKGLENKKLATGESAYIYLTFEVNKDSNGRIILDDESSPKENIAEINGYSTFYKDGTKLPNGVSKGSNDIAGLLDRDSNPGNLVANDLQGNKYEKNFEDDTDRAQSLRIIIDDDAVRKVNGTVWEDERTKNVDNSIIGDGIRQEDEIGVSGATVQLVEKCIDGSEYIWQETVTDENGKYNIEQYIPGDYVIRFYYGDKEGTALTTEEQPVSYNGQDFKSTIYQEGIEQSGKTDISGKYDAYTNTERQNESGTYGYDIYKSDSNATNYSDAKDIWSTSNRSGLEIKGPVQSARLVQGRDEVINYSKENVTNHKAEVLASPYHRPSYNGTEYSDEEMSALYKELMDETYMTAETGVIVVEFEYDRQQSDGIKGTENNKDNSSKDYVGDNKYNSNYSLNNIDLGLTERPKAQLEMDKSVANVKVTLANGSILFDINGSANNALWQDHKEYDLEKHQEDGKYEEYYDKDDKHRYSYREEIDKLVRDTDKGLIQLTMDEELMHGATIQVTYTVKVTNVGEVDYIDDATKDFYYNAEILGANTVTTTANQVVDIVQNNFQFDASRKENSDAGWAVKNTTDLVNENLMNGKLTDDLNKFNTIIQTESFNTPLKPGEEISKTLILSQLITPENEEDDLTYSNMTEIVKTSNEVGRRMAYSVVGNQDPTLQEPSEVDTSAAEKIVILPPFGEARIYYILGAVVAVILIGGIVLIRRKVLKDKGNK